LAGRILRRIFWLVLFAAILSTVFGWIFTVSNHTNGPAGFSRGVIHGALMPAALPRLLIGQDVTIYAPENTGRTYKLGYTVGVNGCGAIFFGINFWRLGRLRKRWRKQP
jgi:hypothetical protein